LLKKLILSWKVIVIYPELETIKKLAESYNVIPVCRRILADTETPVSIWMKLFKKERYSFLLESVSGEEIVARYSFIGGDPVMTFKAHGNNWEFGGLKTGKGTTGPLAALREVFGVYKSPKLHDLPRFTGGAVGYFTYDSIRLWERIPDKNPKQDPLQDIFFGFYRDLIVFDNKEHSMWLISNIIVEPETNIVTAYKEALYRIGLMEDKMAVRLSALDILVQPEGEMVSNFSKEEFENAVEQSKEYIKAGDIFQVVISQRFAIKVNADPFDMYRVLRVVNPSPYMFYMNIDDTSVIGASPEMLVRVEDGTVEVRPIAGTCPRGKTEKENDELITHLINDPKERAEHIMLVDLGRNDVGRVSDYGSVRVEDMMHIEKYSHVNHIVSNVIGTLREDKDVFDALFSCFPAGTLSGAPKIRAMEIIDELENVKRGLYGGALGYIDFTGNLDTCIVIRTIVYSNGTAYIQAGAGLVADSVPSKEYEETLNKAGALFKAIKKAQEIAGS
jgi:anthranilate synthase component 1